MIVAFGGRMRSGKGEITNVLTSNFGYELRSFAEPLKELCANLLNISIDKLNEMKNANEQIHFILDEQKIKTVSERTSIPISDIHSVVDGVTIKTIREMLQVIGTDVIRRYNTDWHVNELLKTLDANKLYVFDDLRFKNEMDMIKSYGGDCWYVVRPSMLNVSNHISETSLSWKDFDGHVIVNDKHLGLLKVFSYIFFSVDKDTRETSRNNAIFAYLNGNTYADDVLGALMLSKDLFTYNSINFNDDEIDSIQRNSGKVEIHYKNGDIKVLTNALEIEDAKLYL